MCVGSKDLIRLLDTFFSIATEAEYLALNPKYLFDTNIQIKDNTGS